MKIAVLFDGAGLGRLGLERAGHECVGFELNPWKHHLSLVVGSGNCILADATKIKLDKFDAVWASPPCQRRASTIKDLTKKGGLYRPEYANDYLDWCIKTLNKFSIHWIENVTVQGSFLHNDWGIVWNAAQFLRVPLQGRNRIIGGNYPLPVIHRPYRRYYVGTDYCPAITASEWRGCATDRLRASRWYGRKLTIQECAYHQGFKIPKKWFKIPDKFMPDYRHRKVHWEREIYEAIGNGVPVYMAKAFGKAAI